MSPRMMQHATISGRVDDRWTLYEECAMLCYPRRYGGQSLVVNEAMARGLVVVMGDQSPNFETWPIAPIPARPAGWVKTPGGRLQMHIPETTSMIETLSTFTADPEMLSRWQARSLMWARDNAWSVWLPKIRSLIGG